MPNALANSFRLGLLQADLDPIADNIKAVIVSSSYTYSAAHDFLDDVGAGARIATSSNLASKTGTSGYFDCADFTFPAVASGSTIVGMWIYKDSGVEATSYLIAWYDTTAAGQAFSIATNDEDITVTVSSSGLFRV